MRQVVMFDDVRELELWPSKLFDKYLDLTKKEIKHFFTKDKLVDISCPACDSIDKKQAFQKFGLQYMECKNCKTLFLSPRPNNDLIHKFYKESEAADFWYSELYKTTIKKRTIHQSIPRAMWIANITEEFFQKPEIFVSINTISQSLLEEISRLNLFKRKYLFDPYIKNINTMFEKEGFKILSKSSEINANAASAFGVLDRVFSPKDFLKNARSLLKDNGILFITTSTISGFDLQVLWDKTKSIFPPDHINVISIEGFSYLFEKSGFEIIELSTPGQLDVELVKNAIKNNNINISRFISYLLNNRDENAHKSFQEFLQRFKLSSHVRIAARKKE